jgi:spermidine synthase
MTTRVPVGIFFALFTVSGFAGLIYESIWSHYLKLFLGHAAYAQTLVLAIFMGGMAIGSWLASRFTQRIGNLLLGYAFAELGIGLLAIAFHGVFVAATRWAFDTAMPALGGVGVDLFKWSLASLLILPASILLGTTFPLMSAGILRLYPESGGRSLSMLYFTNSFGAAIGVLASGFYLIDHLGLPGTILTAGLLNVTLALVVWLIAKRLPTVGPSIPAGPSAGKTTRDITRVVLVLAFATGAASFIYEISWIRMLSLGLGASTHSFEVMLSAFILAMSLGAFWFRNRIASLGNDLAWLAGLLVAKAFFAVYAVWVYADVLDFIQWTLHAVSRSSEGYTVVTAAGMLASMLVMFPAAFCAGMTLPLATHALTSRGIGESAIGKVYGANTAGCIVGAAFATHIGMELAGLKGLTGLGALLDVAVGSLVLATSAGREHRRRSAALIAVVFAAGAAVFFTAKLDLLRMSSGVYRNGSFADPSKSTVAFYGDGKTATISVVDTGSLRSIKTNGKPDASVQRDPALGNSSDEPTMILLGALPLAVKPGAQLVANIGFGSGLTTHTLLGSPAIRELDTIEIERMVIEGARLFEPRNSRAYGDPRSRVHIEDAKTFFASSPKRYDIIVSEPSNPWVSGVSTLFSDEFYGQVKRYLKDDGVLVQWVQAYEINVGLLASIFQALGKHFGDYTVYRVDSDLIVVAAVKGPLPPLSPQLFGYPNVAAELRYLGYSDLGDLQRLRVAGKRTLAPFFAASGFPLNSDFFPIVDQQAPRSRFMLQTAIELSQIRDGLVPVLALLDGEWPTPLERLSSAGRNRPPLRKSALTGAEIAAVFLSGAADRSSLLTPYQRTSALLARGLLGDCGGGRQEWLDAMTEIVGVSSPYLARNAVTPVFDAARSSRCYKSLDDTGKAHIAWLQAVVDRDAREMLANALFLLEHPRAGGEHEQGLYLQSALASALAAGHAGAARQLRDRYFSRLTRQEQERFALQLVLANLATATEGDTR